MGVAVIRAQMLGEVVVEKGDRKKKMWQNP